MPALLSDPLVRVSHKLMEDDKDAEHFVATTVAALHAVYFPEATILYATEKPPTSNASDRRRRVDGVTHHWRAGSWDLPVVAVWEFKKPNATPSEIEICEGQVFDACERYLRDTAEGACFGFSVIGSFWRVFKYQQPGARFACITGEGPPNIQFYFDISDSAEGQMIDSCLRDLREHMRLVNCIAIFMKFKLIPSRFSRDTIRPDMMLQYTPSTLDSESLARIYDLRRNG
jgi:hypothetical protein